MDTSELNELVDSTLNESNMKNILESVLCHIKEFNTKNFNNIDSYKKKKEIILSNTSTILDEIRLIDNFDSALNLKTNINEICQTLVPDLDEIDKMRESIEESFSKCTLIESEFKLNAYKDSVDWCLVKASELMRTISVNIGEKVHHLNHLSKWTPGIVTEIIENDYLITPCDSKLEKVLTVTENLAFLCSSFDQRKKYSPGARVLCYSHQEKDYFSGLVAEVPSSKNLERYMILFENNTCYYIEPEDVHLIVKQDKKNFLHSPQYIHKFLFNYFAKYPKREMLHLREDQVVYVYCGPIETTPDLQVGSDEPLILKDIYTDDWQEGVVKDVDCSLCLVQYTPFNKKSAVSIKSWFYRGSPLIRLRTQNITKKDVKIIREEEKIVVPATNSKDLILKKLPNANRLEKSGKVHSYFQEQGVLIETAPFSYHDCTPNCLTAINEEIPKNWTDLNFMDLPFRCGWQRQIMCSVTYSGELTDREEVIVFIAPCGRRIRNEDELSEFLYQADSKFTMEFFSFDPHFIIDTEFRPTDVLASLQDLSYGKENRKVSVTNSVDHDLPPFMEYISQRLYMGKALPISISCEEDREDLQNPIEFMVCCDCTDNCRDKSKCACQRTTIEASGLMQKDGSVNQDAGYKHHRLNEPQTTGVYECNRNCHCDSRCANRVVQHGMYAKLEIYKTIYKGWGIRALHSIPKGTFLCIYSGSVYDEEIAEMEGKENGDEYQADLDYIEIIEQPKEGYEEHAAPFTDDEEEPHAKRVSVERNPVYLNENSNDSFSKTKKFRRTTTGYHPLQTQGGRQLSSYGRQNNWLKMRQYFSEELPYVMDAKKVGNLARYFNHSCEPNVFVQNVFINTHDPRFPEVAFFALKNIEAGEELSWDYGYIAGTVEAKELFCYCGSQRCRIRLL